MKSDKKRVAVLFWGLTRSLKFTIDSINENIFDVFKKNDIDYDIYLHTYYFKEKFTNVRSGELNVDLDFNEYKRLKPDYYLLDDQDVIKEQINLESYKTFPSVWEKNNPKDINTVNNFIVAMYSKFRVTELMENSGEIYDYCLFIRPDVLYVNKFEMDFFDYVDDTTVCVPDFQKYGKEYGLMNDRMALTNYDNGCKYGKVFNELLGYSRVRSLHSETFLA